MDEIALTPSTRGWVFADWGSGTAWVRFAKDKRDRLTRVTEVHLLEPTPEKLRKLPLRRIEAAVTMRGAGAVQLALAMQINDEPPDLSARPPKSGVKLERRFKLERPSGKLLDDEFYRAVAHAYQSAVAFGLSPRKAIVADTGAADATVAGWVLEARRRGYLPGTTQGKVNA